MAIENGKYLIYRHIRPDKNEPFYIGISKMNTSRHIEKRSRNSIWWNIVNKNSGEFESEILIDNLSLEEADRKEIEFIDLYGRIKYNTGILANILRGGRGTSEYKHVWSDEYKEMFREYSKCRKGCKGREKSAQERENISIRMKGHKPYNYPGTISVEGRKRLSELAKNRSGFINSKRNKGGKQCTGRMYITNEIKNQFIWATDRIPEGWRRGMAPKVYKDPTKKGRPISIK